MKFLCVPCDEPMSLEQSSAPDRGSVSLVYSCAKCGYEMAMLTNPFETQLVSSLGVKVGPQEKGGAAQAGASKCPFTSMVNQMGARDEATAEAAPAPDASGSSGNDGVGTFPWTAAARDRMQTVPDFVRTMVETGIEKFARERGYERVDETVLDEAREFFGV